MSDLIAQLAHTIATFIAAVFVKGGEGFGERAGTEIFDKIKKVFSRDRQKTLLVNLEKTPDSKENIRELEKELVAMLTDSAGFPPAIKDLLDSLDADAPKLTILYEAYRALERQYNFKVTEIADIHSNSDPRKTLTIIKKKQRVIKSELRRILNKKKRK